ncbi:MAG TPA: glycosyltransferase family 4 protein [Candidatus Pacearchaeota archaeon]|nr:glycosyltransferase family 4 protein [Candidatus Pacearchaeota archaeon]HPR80086.1 glycosyltransferase family 4 protein [Candidatus Pacearchaeota archaeon]
MKIGFISFHSFSNPGGVKNHILGLSKEFEKRGIETKIIVPRRKLKENYGKNVILLGTSIPLNIAGTQGDLVCNFNPLSIKRMLNKEKFDILHFHNFIIPSASQILERSDATNIITFHANTEAAPIVDAMINNLSGLINHKVKGVIGVASFNLEPFKKFNGLKKVIPNGIDLNEFNPEIKKLNKFDNSKINILFLGRIEERKGLIYLLKAYKILQEKNNNLRLIIVGDGPLKEECEIYAKENNLKEIYWEGAQSGGIVPQYFSTCDIYCSPAIFGESFGIVLLEAMALGKPVCGFSNMGYKELLQDTKGEEFLAEPKNEIELAKKLEKLIDNENLRKEMGEWGLKEVQKYSWEKVADKVLEFYKECEEKN